MKYSIGNIEANSKSVIQNKAKEILYTGELFSKLEGEDFEFMKDFSAQFHVEWEIKKGVGLKSINRVKEPNYGKFRAFWIERIDGTSTDISYIINNIQKKNWDREFRLALRKVIEPQIIEYRQIAFENSDILNCPITNQTINKVNSHVDHFSPTFEEIVNEFIAKYEIKLSSELFPIEEDNQVEYDIMDKEMKNKFYQFHLQKANLRMLSIEANLRRKKK